MKNRPLFILILTIGFILRIYGINWDFNFHLHPDERFLTMVGNAMVLPKNFGEYLDPKVSKLNPNNLGYNFFVYGNFPLILNKMLAVFFGNDNYNLFTFQGRFLSAFFDFLLIILVYKTGKLLFPKNKTIPLLSSFFYAIAVYPIQSSHFFTTDPFLNFFMFGSFYYVLKFYFSNSVKTIIFSGVFFGLALASKISALYILPLNLGIIFLVIFNEMLKQVQDDIKKRLTIFLRFLLHSTFYILSYTFSAYLTIRLSSPYYFKNPSFFDFTLNKNFIESIRSLKFFTTKEAWYPPAVQWINKPWWGLLSTTFFAGLGPINFITMLFGVIWIFKNLKLKVKNSKLQLKIKNEQIILYLILFWVIAYFIYQSFSFVKSIRYTIYLYPFYAIFGGAGISVIGYWLLVIGKNFLKKKFFSHLLRFTFYVVLLIWPLLFFTIYLHKNTRVEASDWIYKNLPNNVVILGEHWDDPLPLSVENNYGKIFQTDLLPIFDPDTAEKWSKMKELLSKADYYILSSNRGWGSIPTVPERYPLMSKYYQGLLNNDCQTQIKIAGVCYKKIREFLPYYYKFIRFPDSWIEETFTVYDHPMVKIYKKIK